MDSPTTLALAALLLGAHSVHAARPTPRSADNGPSPVRIELRDSSGRLLTGANVRLVSVEDDTEIVADERDVGQYEARVDRTQDQVVVVRQAGHSDWFAPLDLPVLEKDIAVRPGTGVSVCGTIVDARTRERVQAELALTDLDGHLLPSAVRKVTQQTSDSGAFRLDGLPVGRIGLRIVAPGFGPQRFEHETRPSDGGSLRDVGEIALVRGATLEGRVEDTLGGPIRGAQVRVADHPGVADFSDEDGRFLIGGLPDEQFMLSALDSGRVGHMQARSAETPVTIVLPLAGSISGALANSRGEPVAGTVTARRLDTTSPRSSLATLAGWDGRYRFARVAEGTYEIAAATQEGSTAYGPVAVRAGEEILLEPLSLGRSFVSGEIVDGRGSPIPGAHVVARRSAAERGAAPAEEASVYSDSAGRFRLSSMTLGRYSIAVSHPSYAAASPLSVSLSDGIAEPLRVTLVSGGDIQGIVRLRGGDPPLQATMSGPGPRAVTVPVDLAGTFLFEHLTPGRIMVSLSTTGGARPEEVARKGIDLEDGQRALVDFDIVSLTVDGMVSRGGVPVAGSHVEYCLPWGVPPGGGSDSAAPPRCQESETDADGRYFLTVRTPGTYLAGATIGAERVQHRVLVDAERGATQDFELGSQHLRGLITSAATGSGLPAVRVSIWPVGAPRAEDAHHLLSAADGGIEAWVSSGRYSVSATAAGHVGATVLVDVGDVESLFSLELKAASQVAGRIVDSSGAPVPAVYVTATAADGRILETTRSRPDGAFSLDQLDATVTGTLAAGNRESGYAVERLGRSSDPIHLVLRPGGVIRVESANERGPEIVTAWVSAVDGQRVSIPTEAFEPTGSATMLAPAGRVELSVICGSGLSQRIQVDVQVGSVSVARVAFQ